MNNLSEEEKKAIEIIKGLYIEEYDWYEDSKYCTGHSGKAVAIVENSLKTIINLLNKQQEQIKSLKDENDFLRFMYKGTEEYKAIERYASGDHIPRID